MNGMGQQRDDDLELLRELLDEHAGELNAVEAEAFASMRADLAESEDGYFFKLTDKQRAWAARVRERVAPTYANLASRGLVPNGTPTAESRALDAMLAGPRPLRPPPLPKSISIGSVRASRRHCGRADEGCYAFVNGDCTCGCCS
jgi:hypothetical protein